MTNVHDLVRGRVTLTVDCMDRIYLNGYIPNLRIPGQLVNFLAKHRGHAIPSPALLGHIGERFVHAIQKYAEENQIPVVHWSEVNAEIMWLPNTANTSTDRRAWSSSARPRRKRNLSGLEREHKGPVSSEQSRQSVCVNHHDFYLQDADFGPALIRVSSNGPYPIRACLNGHQWAKQQARQTGIESEALDNGFLSCQDPQRLQAICDRALDPGVGRLPARLPT